MFEVCDSLLNVGPIGNVSMGEPAFLSEEFTNNTDPDLELVTTSGHGKNGAICVLQRTIRPQVVFFFELPSCLDMWTVFGPQTETSQNQSEEDLNHAFLILSQKDSTMILQTGQEINEVDHSGFNTQDQTIYAGNLANNKYIVQVKNLCFHKIVFCKLTKLFFCADFETGSEIASRPGANSTHPSGYRISYNSRFFSGSLRNSSQ